LFKILFSTGFIWAFVLEFVFVVRALVWQLLAVEAFELQNDVYDLGLLVKLPVVDVQVLFFQRQEVLAEFGIQQLVFQIERLRYR
jgi:hypothetical protein